MPAKDRSAVLNPLVSNSVTDAAAAGKSLALIRPKNTRFYYKAKAESELDAERKIYEQAASQGSFFDKQLAALEPSPYEFRFKFEDGTGPHDYALRANKRETFDRLKFTLGGAGERSDGNAFTAPTFAGCRI